MGNRVSIKITFFLQVVSSLILFSLFATGIVDTGGKFTAGDIDTGVKFAAAVSLPPVANLPLVSVTSVVLSPQIFEKKSKWP